MNQNQLLTDKDVASFFKVSVATVWRRVADGTFPKPIKIGNLSRFTQEDLDIVTKKLTSLRAN